MTDSAARCVCSTNKSLARNTDCRDPPGKPPKTRDRAHARNAKSQKFLRLKEGRAQRRRSSKETSHGEDGVGERLSAPQHAVAATHNKEGPET